MTAQFQKTFEGFRGLYSVRQATFMALAATFPKAELIVIAPKAGGFSAKVVISGQSQLTGSGSTVVGAAEDLVNTWV